jgi:hypothetical protein
MAQQTRQSETEYGVDPAQFVKAWETSNTLAEVARKLSELAKTTGSPAMPLPGILRKASVYLLAGVKLRTMKMNSSRSAVVGKLNSLVDEIRAQQPGGPPATT